MTQAIVERPPDHKSPAMTSDEMQKKCPGCGCANPTDEHLLGEYRSLLRAGFNNVFGHNARVACNAVVDMLHDRGITEYNTIFGPCEIRAWTY